MRALPLLLALLLAAPLAGQASRDFDNNADFIATGTYLVGKSSGTALALVKADQITNLVNNIIYWEGLFGVRTDVLLDVTDQWRCNIRDSGGLNQVVGTSSPSTGVWYCVACTFSDSDGVIELWQNAVSAGASAGGAWDGNWSVTADAGRIGNSSAGAAGFDGRIAHVRNWDRRLTTTELAEACRSVAVPAAHHWPLWGGLLTDIGYVGGLNGTDGSTTSFADGPPVFIPGGGQ